MTCDSLHQILLTGMYPWAPNLLANQGQLENTRMPVSFRLLKIRSRTCSSLLWPHFLPSFMLVGVAEAACSSSRRPLASSTRERSASQWTNTRSASSPSQLPSVWFSRSPNPRPSSSGWKPRIWGQGQ